jgi:hypothetical protein
LRLSERERDDALCVLQLPDDCLPHRYCVVLLAVPEPFSGAAVSGPTAWPLVAGASADGSVPMSALFEIAEPLHGLVIEKSCV